MYAARIDADGLRCCGVDLKLYAVAERQLPAEAIAVVGRCGIKT